MTLKQAFLYQPESTQITQDILKEESEEYLMKDQSQGQGFGRQKRDGETSRA